MTIRNDWHAWVHALIRTPEHRAPWQWLLDREHVYPPLQNVAPWKRGVRKDRPRALAMVAFGTGAVRGNDTTIPRWLAVADGDRRGVVPVDNTPDGAALVASELFTSARSRTLYVVPEGGTHYLHGVLRWWGPAWMAAGYRIQPVVSRSVLIVLRVTKGRNAWMLTDWTVTTGIPAPVFGADHPTDDSGVRTILTTLDQCYRQLSGLADWVRTTFQVDIRPTVGGTAVAAAGRFLPPGEKLFRNHPLLTAMCRDGGGYRGGYVFGQRYRGPAYKADVRRLYTAMIARPLPAAWSFGLGYDAEGELPGIYLCTVTGTPRMPVYLSVWCGPDVGFTKAHWYGGSCVAVVPSPEYAGLRAMGLTVRPELGYIGLRPFTFGDYVDHLQDAIRDAGATSAHGEYAKHLGNTLSGKWGTSPHLDALVWASERPAEDADPAFTATGERLDGLWHVRSTRYSGVQQIGLASWVTAGGRSVLYAELVRAMEAGRTVVHCHTDGYLATGSAPDWLPGDTDTIGEWRLVGTDGDAVTVRGGMYSIGGETKTSGASGGTRRMVEVELDRGGYLVGGLRVADRREPA